MKPSLEDYVDVRRRAGELGMEEPKDLCLLPRGFASAGSVEDLVHENDSITLQKFLSEQGVTAEVLQPPGDRLPVIIERDITWVAPVIFVGSDILLNRAQGVSTLVNAIQMFVQMYVASRLPSGKVKLSFVVETTRERTYRKLTFEGSPARIKEIGEVLTQLTDD